MGKRIITTENLEEDVKIENHLRPQLLSIFRRLCREMNLWIMFFFMDLRGLERLHWRELLQMR